MTPRRFFDRTILARAALAVMLAALALIVAACGGGDDEDARRPAVTPPPGGEVPQRLPDAEDRLELVAPPGYVEDGSSQASADWVSGFETRTGCDVRVRTARSDAAVAEAVASGRYDGAAVPSGMVAGLIAAGDLAPINPGLVRNADAIAEGLRDPGPAAVGDRLYGLPHDRWATLLAWRRDRVPGALSRSDAVYERPQLVPYRGLITSHGGPWAIAGAAVWLAANREELGITDPYALTVGQLEAAVALLVDQRPFLAAAWATDAEALRAFTEQEAVIGLVPQPVAHRLAAEQPELTTAANLPREGTTGEAGVWVVAADAEHPGCMYRWMAHALGPAVQAESAQFTGHAPANPGACRFTEDPDFCERLRATDEEFWAEVALRRTPVADCGDDRGRACKTWEEWQAAWAEVEARTAG